ncbi:hypothetical protein BaRGS_00030594 [Batillaria attramentaria]|uniref:Uncharacterized protein n=1 Tax=Batillaria attramentaria TaxID=370345 RepID=A0ABD0JSZ9_9CAEN
MEPRWLVGRASEANARSSSELNSRKISLPPALTLTLGWCQLSPLLPHTDTAKALLTPGGSPLTPSTLPTRQRFIKGRANHALDKASSTTRPLPSTRFALMRKLSPLKSSYPPFVFHGRPPVVGGAAVL